MMKTLKQALAAALCALGMTGTALAEDFVSPEILVLGDSQVMFGSGPAFLEFFSHIKQHCKPNAQQAKDIKELGKMRVGVFGVRETYLASWTARSGKAKDTICKVDPNWNKNAGTYGIINPDHVKYIQIGDGEQDQFCKPGKSAFETMFRPDYYDPKFLLMYFLGNSAKEWANSKAAAIRDVKAMTSQIPKDMPCVYMTTAPSYKESVVDLRLKAQANVEAAFKETGSHCSFVPGMTPETIAANTGNAEHFRLKKDGTVKDPYHPNAKGAESLFAIEGDAICNAIFEQVGGGKGK